MIFFISHLSYVLRAVRKASQGRQRLDCPRGDATIKYDHSCKSFRNKGASDNESVEMNLLGVSGSMRADSYSRRALILALEEANNQQAATRILELRTASLPLYDPDSVNEPPEGCPVTEAVLWADALILATPDYHGSMSGAMKNFLDYHWQEFAGKLFGYVVASHEKGLTVMDHMRTAVRQCYGWGLPYGVAVHGERDFGDDGALKNEALGRRLTMLARDTVIYGAILHQQFAADVDAAVEDSFSARYR